MHLNMVITSKSYIYSRTKMLAYTLDIDPSQLLSYRFSTKYYWCFIYFRLRQEVVERMIWRRKVLKSLPSDIENKILLYVGAPELDDLHQSMHSYLFGMPPLWFIASAEYWDPNNN